MQVNAIQRRQVRALHYLTPEELGYDIIPVAESIIENREAARHLTGKQRKEYLEKYQAALLAFMFKYGARSIADVTVCVLEDSDFDCILRLIHNGKDAVYKPVQLKQLVNHDQNDHVEVQTEINKLKKYNSSHDLFVSIWVNRDVAFDLSHLDFNGLRIE